MKTPEEIATEIIASRAGRMFYYHRSNDPRYRQDEIDEIATALASYGDERAAAERERCAAIADGHQRWNTKEASEGWNIAGAIAADIRAPDEF